LGKNLLQEWESPWELTLTKAIPEVFVTLPTDWPISLQCILTVWNQAEKKNLVIVVSPLVSLVKDQVSPLLSLDISATSLNNKTSEADKRKVESGQFSIIYGSPESWLGNTQWRKMLTSETYKNSVWVVAVDEANVICHW